MGDKFEATGKVFAISPTETKGNFTFRKFVVETGDNPKYPQFVEFQTTRDGIEKLDAFKAGDEIKVTFNLRGREWTSPAGEVRYFNTLDAWKIEGVAKPATAAKPSAPAPAINDDTPF